MMVTGSIFVNDEKVIDYWGQHGAESRFYTLDAQAGMKYEIRIEYMQAGGEGTLQLIKERNMLLQYWG